MKKTILHFALLLAAGLLASGTARAQQAVPNGTLETWALRGGIDSPGQWLTTDDLLRGVLPGFPATGAVTKSSTSHAGSFAAKLTNMTSVLGPVPGFMVLGNALGNLNTVDSLAQLGGLPYTSRAARLLVYYRFSGTVNSPDDLPVVRVMLTKTTGGVRSIVAAGHQYLPTTATAYTLATVPLVYQQGIAPDSIHIAFGSSDYDGNTYTAGNTLYVDDVVMTGTVTATRDAQLQAAVGVYPNPSATGLFTLAAQEATLVAAPITVTDALGRVVLRQPATATGSTRTVDLRQQPAGLYSLRLDTPRGPVMHQLVVQ